VVGSTGAETSGWLGLQIQASLSLVRSSQCVEQLFVGHAQSARQFYSAAALRLLGRDPIAGPRRSSGAEAATGHQSELLPHELDTGGHWGKSMRPLLVIAARQVNSRQLGTYACTLGREHEDFRGGFRQMGRFVPLQLARCRRRENPASAGESGPKSEKAAAEGIPTALWRK
jgi:hypothetical protein